MKIQEIIHHLEQFAPLMYQEPYDNSGLLVGDRNTDITGVLLCLDCTEKIVEETMGCGCNLIIAHHPIIFSGLKKLTGSDYVQRTVIKAIQNNIAIYACHTNLDNVYAGVNLKISQKLELKNTRILSVKNNTLNKLVTFVPLSHLHEVQKALFAAGAGHIGNYDSCGFTVKGTGTFKGNSSSQPFTGKPNELSEVDEIRLETVFEPSVELEVVNALKKSHPYEEVAYDILPLNNSNPGIGSGMAGVLENETGEDDFILRVKKVFGSKVIRHTAKTGKKIKSVAVCGGSGRFLLPKAIEQRADVFITSDFKYHDFFDVDGKLLLLDIGHYESEQFTVEIFYDLILKKNPTFAVHLSKINTNPINWF